jgi:hypothetical protein
VWHLAVPWRTPPPPPPPFLSRRATIKGAAGDLCNFPCRRSSFAINSWRSHLALPLPSVLAELPVCAACHRTWSKRLHHRPSMVSTPPPPPWPWFPQFFGFWPLWSLCRRCRTSPLATDAVTLAETPSNVASLSRPYLGEPSPPPPCRACSPSSPRARSDRPATPSLSASPSHPRHHGRAVHGDHEPIARQRAAVHPTMAVGWAQRPGSLAWLAYNYHRPLAPKCCGHGPDSGSALFSPFPIFLEFRYSILNSRKLFKLHHKLYKT